MWWWPVYEVNRASGKTVAWATAEMASWIAENNFAAMVAATSALYAVMTQEGSERDAGCRAVVRATLRGKLAMGWAAAVHARGARTSPWLLTKFPVLLRTLLELCDAAFYPNNGVELLSSAG